MTDTTAVIFSALSAILFGAVIAVNDAPRWGILATGAIVYVVMLGNLKND